MIRDVSCWIVFLNKKYMIFYICIFVIVCLVKHVGVRLKHLFWLFYFQLFNSIFFYFASMWKSLKVFDSRDNDSNLQSFVPYHWLQKFYVAHFIAER